MYRNRRTDTSSSLPAVSSVVAFPESLSEPRPGARGEDWGMEMGVDSGRKEKEDLEYFIRELLLLSILVFEKLTLQSREVLSWYDFVNTQCQVLNFICFLSLSLFFSLFSLSITCLYVA